MCNPLNNPQWDSESMDLCTQMKGDVTFFCSSQKGINVLQKQQPAFSKTCSDLGQQDFQYAPLKVA